MLHTSCPTQGHFLSTNYSCQGMLKKVILDHLQVMKKNAVSPCKFDPGLDVGFPYFVSRAHWIPFKPDFFYVGFKFTTVY